MDRWPSEREEPKAPDKNVDALNSKDNNIIMKLKSETPYSNCAKTDEYPLRVLPSHKESSVSSLNEPDLKALLEEAMAYKRPKDIQGKSELFKELLQSVESEKKYSILPRPEKQSNRKPRRKQMNKKEIDKTTHEGPFQDLIVHMSDCDTTSNKRHMKYSLKCSPSNVAQLVPVDASSVIQESNPEVAALLENGTIDSIEELQEMLSAEANIYQVKDMPTAEGRTSNSYLEESEEESEARTTGKDALAINSSKESEELKEPATETKKSLDENGNSVSSSRIENLVEKKAKARRLKAKNDRNTILSHHIEGHRSDIAEDIDAIMKYIESPKISDSKSGRQRNSVGLSKNSSRTNNKLSRVRDKSTEAFSRKSPKTKESKLQKSSSLEEVSISKFEDLTQGDKDEDVRKVSNKSKGNREMPKASGTKCQPVEPPSAVQEIIPPSDRFDAEQVEADFLPVTKKNRKKKVVADNSFRSGRRNMPGTYRGDKMLTSYMVKSQKYEGFHSSRSEFKRRKSISSIPSSDKSGDSSDLDSVHSFPVSSSKGKGNKPSVSLYTGSTPQISYADIARSNPSPSRLNTDLSPSTDNFGDNEETVSSPKEAIPTVILQLPQKKDSARSSVNLRQDYPPLNTKCTENNFSSSDMFVEYTVLVPKRNSCTFQSSCVNVEETVLIEMPSSDISEMEGINVALDNHIPSKRPPVILMNSNSNDSNEVNDLVFGFEVNEQLLNNCSNSEPIKNSDVSQEDNADKAVQESVEPEPVGQEESPSRPLYQYSENHLEIVQFIESEWELTMAEYKNEDSPSKVVYYTP